MQPINVARLAEYQLKHKFMVQSMILSDNIPIPEDISYAVSFHFLYMRGRCHVSVTPDKDSS